MTNKKKMWSEEEIEIKIGEKTIHMFITIILSLVLLSITIFFIIPMNKLTQDEIYDTIDQWHSDNGYEKVCTEYQKDTIHPGTYCVDSCWDKHLRYYEYFNDCFSECMNTCTKWTWIPKEDDD